MATVANEESQTIRHVTSHASCWLAGAVWASPQHWLLPQTQQTSIRHGGVSGQAEGWLLVDAPHPAPVHSSSHV